MKYISLNFLNVYAGYEHNVIEPSTDYTSNLLFPKWVSADID
jgi:hypothetical protein